MSDPFLAELREHQRESTKFMGKVLAGVFVFALLVCFLALYFDDPTERLVKACLEGGNTPADCAVLRKSPTK